MQLIPAINDGFWLCKHTWKRSRLNTFWCLLGCSIGDFGTIFAFQMIEHSWSVWQVMTLAIINGLLTSIALETIILTKQMAIRLAFKTAIGMSFISMIAMEFAMNLTDVLLTGGAILTWWVIPFYVAGGICHSVTIQLLAFKKVWSSLSLIQRNSHIKRNLDF